MRDLELTVVAARRPALLARTLESFHQRLFRHFNLTRASINIDPAWGDASEAAECVTVIRKLFPGAVVFAPEKPGFTAAVKRLWTHSRADYIFHLEDDWLLMEDIEPSLLNHFNDATVAQVSLMAKEKNWDRAERGDYHYVKRRASVLGIPLPFRITRNAFTTSPAFTRGTFARGWAQLMNEAFDPEKQMYSGLNLPLEKFARGSRNYIHSGQEHYSLVVDTGREWREARNIEKKIIAGQPIWTEPPHSNDADGQK
jgi:hypothetical protein